MMASWRRAEQPDVSEPMQRERYSQELQRNIKATRKMEWMDAKDKVGLQTVCCPAGVRLSQALRATCNSPLPCNKE